MEHFLLKQHLFLLILCVSFLECRLDRQPSYNTGVREEKEEELKLICPYRNSDKNLNELERWHAFLNSLFCKFSEYNVQLAKRSYNVNHTQHFKNLDCEIRDLIEEVYSTEIDEKNFQRFLNKTQQCSKMEYEGIKNIVLTKNQIEELNYVFSLTLKDKTSVNCEGINVYIKGNYITTGDIIDIFNMTRKVSDAKCKGILSSDKIKFVNIFALNTFFIDVTLNSSFTNSHKIVLMSVIAPKWENIGKNIIELKGEDAKLPSKRNGMDGEPGKHGGPGGNFFGIGSEFVNGTNLEISVSGGDGSGGHDGRNGKNGRRGNSPRTPSDIECHGAYCVGSKMIDNFNCKKREICRNPSGMLRTCIYEIFGETGMKGGNGGKGGKGGKGGYPGNITLIELKSFSEISLLRNSGQDGSDGKGGAGGFGGKKGYDIVVQCHTTLGLKPIITWNLESIDISPRRAASGQRGLDGGNAQGMENPKSAFVINNFDKTKIINEYKSYVRENLLQPYTKVILNDFFNQLETNTKVKNLYNTLGLIDDLQHLEDQYHNLNAYLNLIPFYQSLLKRISEYAYAPKETGDPRMYKNVLCYVYAAALGTIQNIQENRESDLIIDIPNYLRSVENEIYKLKDLKNSKYKAILINKYKDEYKHEIDVKINEAKELISKEITPEIHNMGTEIDTQIEALVNEVIQLQEKTAKEHKMLEEKQQQLKNTLALQGMFSVFKIFGAVVSFLGPIGEVAGSVIETGITIAESFISDDADNHIKVLELPESVSELESVNFKIESIANQRITYLRNTLESISLEINKHPDILSNMSFKISEIKDKLGKIGEYKHNFQEIQALENELETTLEFEKEKADPRNEKLLAVIKNLKNIVQLSTLLGESYDKYKNNQEKLDAISSALEQNEENMKKLKQYEQKVYDSITPMLQNIQSDVQDIMGKLGTKSKVALDVTKWHVDRSLRDMILLMRQLTRGFQVQDNLARCLENLEEAMNALIRVYQHIQDYQEDQTLASYIAEISSVTATDIIVANNALLQEELRNAVRNLEITVRSKIVVQRYKIAMKAFKQFVFPFAHHYFHDLILPPNLAVSDNENKTSLDDFISKVGAELEKINLKLEDYKYTVATSDECMGQARFQRDSVAAKPFFVWRNEHYKDMFSKLLSGNSVTIKSDVRNSAPDKDAIKFSAINFNFISRNKTLQRQVNDKLKGFQISITHLGNSDYRYSEKIYQMMTGSTHMWYYFEKKSEGGSNSYKKIMHGDVTLSPYASWKIKLGNTKNIISFKDLEIYKDSVDLILEGYGYFLNKIDCDYTDSTVDRYYKAIDTNYYVDSNKD